MKINPNLLAGTCEEGIVLTTEASLFDEEANRIPIEHDIFLTWTEVNKLYAHLDSLLRDRDSLLSDRNANQTNR